MLIRQEAAEDYTEVYNVVKEAFFTAEISDGNEQELVIELRKSSAFEPELSLVAVEEGKIVGYILFTKVKAGKCKCLALAPLAVLPMYQHKGIGLALIKEGHKAAKALGYDYSVVLGQSAYYP